MRNYVKILIFLLSIFIVFQTTIFSQSTVKAKKVVIYAEKGWQDSGIRLKRNQYYSITARGNWISGYNTPFKGPEGSGYGTIDNDALVGWISDKKPEKLGRDSYNKHVISKVIFIACGGLFKSYGDGKLWLAMGDWSGCKECSGSVEVLITIFE